MVHFYSVIDRQRQTGRDAYREAAGAVTLSLTPQVEEVHLGDEGYREVHGRLPPGQPEKNADIVARTHRGTYLLGEGKGRAEPAKAVLQLETTMKFLANTGRSVDGYYIFKPSGDFTQPGYSAVDGVLHYEGAAKKIDGKLVYVVDMEPNSEQLRTILGE